MKKRILIIDDEASIRELLERFLTLKGYEVRTAGTAEEALRVAAEVRPDLVVSDLTLADSDGLVLIDELRRRMPGVPVLLLTGVRFGQDIVEENILERVSGYLHKTASLQTVLAEIGRLLSGPASR